MWSKQQLVSHLITSSSAYPREFLFDVIFSGIDVQHNKCKIWWHTRGKSTSKQHLLSTWNCFLWSVFVFSFGSFLLTRIPIFLLPLIHIQNSHFLHLFGSGLEIQQSNCWISSPDRKGWRKWLFWAGYVLKVTEKSVYVIQMYHSHSIILVCFPFQLI